MMGKNLIVAGFTAGEQSAYREGNMLNLSPHGPLGRLAHLAAAAADVLPDGLYLPVKNALRQRACTQPPPVDLCSLLDDIAARTANGTGWCVKTILPESADSRFIACASSFSGPIVDIGCGWGEQTLALLQAGAQVIAIDPSARHLNSLSKKVPGDLRHYLQLIEGEFPHIDIADGTASAILAARVGHFWNGEELELAVAKMFEILASGGQVCFIETWPFWRALHAFASEYERRLQQADMWPGLMDMHHYAQSWVNQGVVPARMHYLTADILERTLLKQGFIIRRKSRQFVTELPEMEVACELIAEKP